MIGKWIAASSFALLAMTLEAAYADELPPECRYLPKYEQPAGVAYQPGVDVHGKAVVSADINAAPFQMPDVITVPLTVDLIERARDLPGQYEGLEGKGDLGVIEIHKDGLVTYNGQDWSSQFYALCGYDDNEHGQEPDNTVISPNKSETPPETARPGQDSERILFGGEYRD